MKVFLKKPSVDSLHSLNEEEIQKKLYGTYHKNTSSINTGGSTFTRPAVASFTGEKRPQPAAFHFNFWPPVKSSFAYLTKWLKLFPWKFSILITGLLICSISLFQFLSSSLSHFHWTNKKTEKIVSTQMVDSSPETQSSKSVTTKKIDMIQEKTSTVTEKTTEVPKKSYYAVQICTYQKEADAKALTAELKTSKFSAFYERMQSTQNKTPYYVVFLGKDESFAHATSNLKSFRKSEHYQKFPDAFVRSV